MQHGRPDGRVSRLSVEDLDAGESGPVLAEG
jgi:hypothetical protein